MLSRHCAAGRLPGAPGELRKTKINARKADLIEAVGSHAIVILDKRIVAGMDYQWFDIRRRLRNQEVIECRGGG
jgi:hypothetical protein